MLTFTTEPIHHHQRVVAELFRFGERTADACENIFVEAVGIDLKISDN